MQLFMTLQSWLASRLDRKDEGATAVEYGLLVALIAAVIIVAVTTLGSHVNNAFNSINNGLANT